MAMVVHGKQPNHMAVTAAASKLSPQTAIRLTGGFSIVNRETGKIIFNTDQPVELTNDKVTNGSAAKDSLPLQSFLNVYQRGVASKHAEVVQELVAAINNHISEEQAAAELAIALKAVQDAEIKQAAAAAIAESTRKRRRSQSPEPAPVAPGVSVVQKSPGPRITRASRQRVRKTTSFQRVFKEVGKLVGVLAESQELE